MSRKKLLPIVLSARRPSWRMADAHADESDSRFLKIRSQILQRDDHSCAFCGFRAMRFQEMHHLDDDHGNNKSSNLVTACCFCHACFHLGMAGTRRTGVVIWCPELSQAEINNVCRAVFVAETVGGTQEQAARALYAALSGRAAVVEQDLGPGASNPAALGQALLEMTPQQYSDRQRRLSGLRLLPKSSAFGTQVAYWQTEKSLFGGLAVQEWDRLLPALSRDAAEDAAEDADDDE